MVLDELEATLFQETALSVSYIDELMFKLKREMDRAYREGYDDALGEVRRYVLIEGLTY